MKATTLLILCIYGINLSATNPAIQVLDKHDRYDSFKNEYIEFDQQEIKSSAGVYFDEMANLQVYHSEWTFVTYVNLSYFVEEMKHLEKTVENIQNLCDSIKNEFSLSVSTSHCDHTLPQLHNVMEEIKNYEIKWFFDLKADTRDQNLFDRSKRKKRNLLGTISRRLFFSLPEEDVAFYRNQINVLKTENLQHVLFANNQTSLFKDTIKVLNKTMNSQIVQHLALQRQFDDLEYLLNNATVLSTLTGKLNQLMQYTTFVLTSFSDKQRRFFDLITSKSKNVQWIAPKMLMDELERVNKLIASQGLHFPLPLRENLSKFYQITSTEGEIIDNNLVLRFSVPLVEMKNFIVYKILKLPYRNQSNEFSFISPKNEYIALDSPNEQFFTLTLDELKSCHKINAKHRICKQSFPIRRTTDDLGCEINLLRNTNVTHTCDIKTSNLTEDIWEKLQKPNTFLYTLTKAQTVEIICPHSRTKLIFQDTGIITLSQKCRIKTERIEIRALEKTEQKNVHDLIPSAKFNSSAAIDVEKSKHIKSLSNSKLPEYLSEDDINQLTQISDNINHLKEIYKSPPIYESHIGNDIHPIILLIIAVIVLILIVVVIVVFFKYCAIPGCNILIYLILFALVIPGVLYFI
ncbi:uncharacterized protein LOC116341043 [Contarinia nasturtii]|uniref:uncharacterized protein LOC116341043 n=1 Tax=Contarinia nasturtii TaxID=265458 RepID=UPI0012D4A4C6|nr:uncharacterized protein LOC116341043 [Contarinia nasturtii]XP_031623756.1 uncharacterized protein LOC116341043 [Contarinia nasturtii]